MHLDAPARRITTWLAILGYAIVASGLPLPVGGDTAPDVRHSSAARRLAAKDRSRPFPCMDKPCGCDTAERCFTSCCCHTPAETLAWARAHGLEPGVLLALERRAGRGSQTGPRRSGTAGVFATVQASSCCVVTAPPAESSCCSTASPAAGARTASRQETHSDRQSPAAVPDSIAAVCVQPDVTENERPPTGDESSRHPRSRVVTLRAMLACGGLVADWFVAGAALPPPRVEVSHVMLPVDERLVVDAVAAGLRAAPDAPPPRAA